MAEKKLQKKIVDKIGRIFAMLFNRAVMYNMNHPFTTQSMSEFFKSIHPELKAYSPIVVIMHNDSFFIEDEPLDPRVNTAKMLMHFKKTGIQSVSFEDGLTIEILVSFFTIFTDNIRYPSVELMKEACTREGITKARVNHVFFKKVTADEEVLNRDEIKTIAENRKIERHKTMKDELLDMISGGLAIEELGKSFSITQFLAKPNMVSNYLNTPDTVSIDLQDDKSPGAIMFDHVHKIRTEIDKASEEVRGAKLHDLAASVVRMREELVKGIIERKQNGVIYDNEIRILDEAKELSDKVVLELVKDEYKQGATSVNRLSQILRRLIPDNDELQRILPKLKETLLLEGMSLSDFLQLTGELEKEISNQSIAGALKKSAESIGVSGEDLLKEITSNPLEAAELIYLATELRKETGDKKALSDVLVEYIERITGSMALDSKAQNSDFEKDHMKSVISTVESDILERLKVKNLDSSVMDSVAERLNARMDNFLEKLEVNFNKRQASFGTWDHETTSLIKLFEDEVGDTDQLKSLLLKVRDTFRDAKTGEVHYDAIKFDLDDVKNDAEVTKEVTGRLSALPKGVHNRKSILYFIEKEIFRATRYQTPFSVATFSILKAIPQKKFAAGSIARDDVTYHILENVSQLVRDTDIVGLLDQKKIICLLPMTDEEDSRLALRRFLKSMHGNLIKINDIPFEVKFAGTVTSFNKSITPALKDFIRKAEHDIYDMVQRIKNLQTMY
jgi:GGDEF domain-containing protein